MTKEGAAIRRAAAGDAAALAVFAERVFRDAFGADNRPLDLEAYVASAFSEAIQRGEIEDPRLESWLLLAGDRLAGYAQLWEGPAPPAVPAGPVIELRRFYVDRPWQGRGLAARLMTHVFEAALRRGAGAVWLGVGERNARAIAFYRKCGFADVGSQTFELGSDRQQDRVMWRRVRDE
jgi:GNAT superfamily N-acetyltransferase